MTTTTNTTTNDTPSDCVGYHYDNSCAREIRKSTIRIDRLTRKLEKTRIQRDFYRKEYEELARVLEKFPLITERFETFEEQRRRSEASKALARRVQEQETLIRLLRGEKLTDSAIKTLYNEVIKEEYRKIN